MGWKALADFRRDPNIPLADARARLEVKGIVATEAQPRREITETNQIDRPTTLADLVRGVRRE
jgi:hypothetical protein